MQVEALVEGHDHRHEVDADERRDGAETKPAASGEAEENGTENDGEQQRERVRPGQGGGADGGRDGEGERGEEDRLRGGFKIKDE